MTLNNSNEKDIFKLINKVFNYSICNIQYFTSAFTHKNTSDDNYERLEILGDSVLQLTVTELLFIEYPKYTEGQITVVRQNLVNSKSLKKIFLSLKLEDTFKKIFLKVSSNFNERNIFLRLLELTRFCLTTVIWPSVYLGYSINNNSVTVSCKTESPKISSLS